MTPVAPRARSRTVAVLALALTAVFLTASCARLQEWLPLPGTSAGEGAARTAQPPTWQSLATNENLSRIQDLLQRFPEPAAQQAAQFLVENLPPADAASMGADELAEHVTWALRARADMPWGRNVPWDIFLHYVLPHRAAQEPAQPFRALLFRELAPRLAHAGSMEEAALELALWCRERLEYVATQRRDAGVLTILARGKARCEEASILYCAAARSVGIPARIAVTPAWTFADDNHAWVEVWIDGTWHYLDPANPGPELDHAWFSANARRAVLVTTTVYGGPPEENAAEGRPPFADAPVLRSGPGWTRLNVTARYAPVRDLHVAVLGPDGKPLPHAEVLLSIYNYATFSPAARLRCDARGRASVALGAGSVLLTATAAGRTDYAVARAPGRNGGDQKEDENQETGGPEHPVVLDLRRDRVPAGTFALTCAPPVPAAPDAEPTGRARVFLDRKAAAERIHADAFAHLAERAREELADIALPGPDQETRNADAGPRAAQDEELAKAANEVLAQAGTNAPHLLEFLRRTPPELRAAAVPMLYGMWAADRAAPVDPAGLARDLDAVLTARQRAVERLGLQLPQNDAQGLWEHALCQRVTRYEPFSLYFATLGERFASLARGDVRLAAWNVAAFTSGLARIRAHALGPVLTPVQAVRLGAVTSELERAIVCVAILRSLGVPARHFEQWGRTEYFDGAEWLPVYPAHPELTGNREADEAAKAFYGPASGLDILFRKNGAPLAEGEAQYYRDFALSVFAPRPAPATPATPDLGPAEIVGFDLREPGPRLAVGHDAATGGTTLRLPAGDYFLITGVRDATGTPLVRVQPVTTYPERTRRGTADLDRP